MKRVFQRSALCLLLWPLTSHAADEQYYKHVLGESGTNNQWSREIRAPVLIDTNNNMANVTRREPNRVMLRPRVEIAGIRLGMAKNEVLTIWGKPKDTMS